MLSTLLQLAQTDALTGSAGWAGLGISGSVLFWLLYKHLPAKDAQMEKLIADKDRHVEKLISEFSVRIDILSSNCEKERREQASNFETYRKDQSARYQNAANIREEEWKAAVQRIEERNSRAEERHIRLLTEELQGLKTGFTDLASAIMNNHPLDRPRNKRAEPS